MTTATIDRSVATVHAVETLAGVDALAPEWRALERRSEGATPFSTWEWNAAVARHAAPDAALRILVAREGDDAIGLAPLALRRYYGLRALVFLGTGLLEYPLADYQDFLLAAGREREAVEALFDAIATRSSEWDLIRLQEVPPSSPLPRLAAGAASARGWRLVREAASDVHVIDLPDAWDDYRRRLSSNTRNALERKTRKLLREKGARFRRIERVDELDAAMESLFDLHTRRWRSAGRPGIFRHQWRRALHREFARGLLARGALDLMLVDCEGETIGARYSFEMGGDTYFYASGFAPDESWSPYSLGFVMDGENVRQAIERGLRRADFLRGDGRYKKRYATQEAFNSELLIARGPLPLARCRSLRLARRLAKRALGPVRDRLRGRPWSS